MPTTLDDIIAEAGAPKAPPLDPGLDSIIGEATKPPATAPNPHLQPDRGLDDIVTAARGPQTSQKPPAEPGLGIAPGRVPWWEYARRSVFGGPQGETAIGRTFPSMSGAVIGDTPKADLPLVRFEEAVPPGPGTTRNLTRGVLSGATGLTTAGNLEIMAATGGLGAAGGAISPIAAKAIHAGLSAYFAYEMGKGAYSGLKDAYAAHQAGNDDEAARLLGYASSAALLAAFAGKHGVKEAKGIFHPTEPPAAEAPNPAEQKALPAGSSAGEPPGPPGAPGLLAEEAPQPVKPNATDRVSASTPNPPTAAIATAPEQPATLAIQVQQLSTGGRRAVMFPKGSALPTDYPPGVAVTHDAYGNVYLFRPDLIKRTEITRAAKANELSTVLGSADQGMGAPDKADLQGEPVVVSAHAPDGTEVQSTASDHPNLPATLAATEAVTPDGGEVRIHAPEEIVAQRQAETHPELDQIIQEAAGGQEDVNARPPGEGGVDGTPTPAPRPTSGHPTEVLIPGESQPIAAHYEVRELDDIQPSHSGLTFQPNERYAHHNERDYSKPENQQRVIQQGSSAAFNPRYHITDNPDALNGPPVIDQDGNVLGGNSRVMALQRVFASPHAGAENYRNLLKLKAAQFGIDPEALNGIRNPVLVRVADDNALVNLPGGAKWAIRKTNVQGTAALSPSERAAADAGQLTSEMTHDIADAIDAEGENGTLNDALSGRRGTAIVNKLIADGFFTEQERPALMDGKTGAISAAAKERISKALLGQFFRDSDQIARTPASLRAKLERLAAPLSKIADKEGWDLRPLVREAVDVIEYAEAHDIRNMDELKAQGDMFGASDQFSDRVLRIADLIRNGKPLQVLAAFRRYANSFSEDPGLFGETSADEAFQDAFESKPGSVTLGFGLGGMQPFVDAVAKGMKQFSDDDVKPLLARLIDGSRESIRSLVHVLNPRAGVPPENLDTIYRMRGGRAAAQFLLEKKLDRWNKDMNALSQPEMIDFIDRQKQGQPQANARLQELSDFLHELDDRMYHEILKYKPSLPYLENHYRVLWKELPQGAGSGRGGFLGLFRRPLQGSKGMLKQHTLDTMSEGIARGGVPYSYNPIKMFEAHYADAMKYVTAQRLWEQFKDNGTRVFVHTGKSAPEGYSRLNDSIAKVYFPTDAGLVNTGEWYVEDGAARLLNNMLSRDLIREVPFGRAMMAVKNGTTAVELSLSPFHAVFETMEAIGSQIGIALREMYNLGIRKGDIRALGKGAADLFMSPTAAVRAATLGSTAKKAFGNYQDFIRTAEGQAWVRKNPEAMDGVMAFFNGGGEMNMSRDFKVSMVNSFNEYWKSANAQNLGKYASAAVRLVPAINEKIMQPLFEHYIPNLKLGFFLKEYALAKLEYADRISSGELSMDQIAQRTVDSIENRFGEMNFDNLYWNRTFKTALQLMFRSVTWKLGNLRANVGAITGEAAEIKRAIQKGELPVLHANTAWLLGMGLWTSVLGSVIYMAAHKGQRPQNIKDVVYPEIDAANKIRVSLPTYFRDMVHFFHSPGGYVKSSMSGEIGRLADIWENKDFYGNEVYSPDDPLPARTWAVMKHVVPLPFMASSSEAAAAEGGTGWTKYSGALGFPKAPKYLEQSSAEQLANEYAQGERKQGSRTSAEATKARTKSDIRKAFRQGTDASKLVDQGIKEGVISRRDIPALRRQARSSPLAAEMNGWSLSKMLEVYDRANPEERKGIDIMIRRKLIRSRTLSSEWNPRVRSLAKKYFSISPAEKLGDVESPDI